MAEVAIEDDDQLYQRLHPQHLRPDGTVNSAAFMRDGRPDASLSLNLARLATVEASLPEEYRRRGYGLGALRAGDVRALGLEIRHDPLPDNSAHVLVIGSASRRVCHLLASRTRIVVPVSTPPGNARP